MTTSVDDPLSGEELTPESLEIFFRSGVRTNHKLNDEPYCQLRIDPTMERMEFQTPAVGPEPDVQGLERVRIDTIEAPSGTWYVLSVDAEGMHYETYGLFLSVVDAMRAGASFAAAAGAALRHLRLLLKSKRRLSDQQQLGLIGELLLVRHLLESKGEEATFDWWLGPLAEQHDFAMPFLDVEVKTTAAERRDHMISGAGQLDPVPGRPLWLLSVQLTRAGGGDGISLAELVGEVRNSLHTREAVFVSHLEGLGWRDEDQILYDEHFMLRSEPRAYLVDRDFPAITHDTLNAAVPHPELITRLVYRIDVTTLVPGDPGFPLNTFVRAPRGDNHEA